MSFVAKGLLIVGLLFGQHRYKFHFLGVGAAAAFLMIGPYWPFGSLHKLLYFSFPPLWLARHLSIFFPFVSFFIVFFVGLGCDRMLARLSEPLSEENPNPPRLSRILRFFEQRFPPAVREGMAITITLAFGAVFLMALPLTANFFHHLYHGLQVKHILGPTIFVWLAAIAIFYPLLRRVRYSVPVLLFFSILSLEQWTIGEYFHQSPGLFQKRATYFKDFTFPTTALDAFQLPSPRIIGLDFKKSYLSYGPTLFKANVALEDLLPPRCGGSNLNPGFFGMNFPMGLYHFWPKPYLTLYEIGEVRPESFTELIGIGRPLLDFYPTVVRMDKDSQETFFRQAPSDRVKSLLQHTVFLEEPLPQDLSHLQTSPPSVPSEETATSFQAVLHDSFETWEENGLPAHWTYNQGGRGGRIEPMSAKENVKEDHMSVALYPSSQGPSSIRYAFPDVSVYRGRPLTAEVWMKSLSSSCNSIAMDIQTGAKGNPVTIKSYTKRGEWENVRIEKRIEHDAAYLLLTLNVNSAAIQPGYFDSLRVLAGDVSPVADRSIMVHSPPEKLASDQIGKMTDRAFSHSVISYIPTRLELEATADQDGVLLYRENNQADWVAYVDGEQTALYRANLAFKALPLRKGKHTIIFEYRPRGFLLALSVYLAGNGAFLIFGCTVLLRRIRRTS